MKVLLLEDNPDRQRLFKCALIGHDVTITEYSKECIKYLKENKYDYLFSDHDLGGKVFVESGEDTGWEVAKWLHEQKEKPKEIVIHSLNESGAKNMLSLIPEAKIIPFAWQLINI